MVMDEYEKYVADCKIIKKTNESLLTDFEAWLKSSGYSDKTIKNHLSNIEFYINEYLLYEDIIEAKSGVHYVSMFLGYWFINKATWASQASIKNNATSLKKFYTFLVEKSLIENDDLNELEETIKKEMPEWLAALKRYDDLALEGVEDI
jgi:site-specific recombinase XerD